MTAMCEGSELVSKLLGKFDDIQQLIIQPG
jgi:hypothetical protein